MNSNVKGHKNDLQKSSDYWTVERSKKLLKNGKIHYSYKQNDNTDVNYQPFVSASRAVNKIYCIML